MSRHQSRPGAGTMHRTIFSKVSDSDYENLLAVSVELDRPLGWLIRQGLIKAGYMENGK
jgi:hypothetical protein